ncbi:MAG: YihY family inner membrane protein [Oligoflexales bacterium]|nr:YihY family inner membrane protein [Oligoflexales bacterium]
MRVHAKIDALKKHLEGQKSYQFSQTIMHNLVELGLFKHASAMAYMTLLSVVPSLAVSFSLLSAFTPLAHQKEFAVNLKQWVLSKLTEGAGVEVASLLDQYMVSLDLTQLGLSGFLGLVLSLVLLLRQIEITFNLIWRVRKNRNIFARFFYFLSLLCLFVFVASFALLLLRNLGFQSFLLAGSGKSVGAWVPASVISYSVSFFCFFFILKLVPYCKVQNKPALIGAITTTLLFHFSKWGFFYYGQYIANYQAIYGALAALPLFLLWLYLCWVILLLGAALTRLCQHEFQDYKKMRK